MPFTKPLESNNDIFENPDYLFGRSVYKLDVEYSPATCDNIMRTVLFSNKYTDSEKTVLGKMLTQIRDQGWVLDAVEIYKANGFDFEIQDYEKYKGYLIREVYLEIIEQILKSYEDYEDVSYDELRKWFRGMTINIDLLVYLDKRLKEKDIEIRY